MFSNDIALTGLYINITSLVYRGYSLPTNIVYSLQKDRNAFAIIVHDSR